MRTFLQAYKDACKSGYVSEAAVARHVERQAVVDRYLPETDSFFYIMDLSSNTYRFIGKQQECISGFANEEFYEKGIELFVQQVHPDDVRILLAEIYPTFIREVTKLEATERMNVQGQYNFRFRRKSGEYLHMLEQVHIIELDEAGKPSLLLGNAIAFNCGDDLSLRLTIKTCKVSGCQEVIFSKTFRHVPGKLDLLTRREREVLLHLVKGKTSKEIGARLFISRHTVDTHRRNILEKLKCESGVDLIRIAFNEGLL